MTKVLTIQFKYLGDVALSTPTLRALKEFHGAGSELHALVPEEAAPLLEHMRWVDRVWAFPRRRGRIDLRSTWPVVRSLRAQRFDVSIDLAGNDRGALVSRLIGAPKRLGVTEPRGPLWRRACYTQCVEAFPRDRHESVRLWAIAAALGVPFPADLRMHIAADPARAAAAREYLRGVEVLCFINASQPKKEWPLSHWAEFYAMASAHGVRIGFSGGPTQREKAMLHELRERLPAAEILDPGPLEALVAALAQLKGFISADTGPLHFAAALGVPTIGLFGPTSAHSWAPLGEGHMQLQGSACPCSGHAHTCQVPNACMAAIAPAQVYEVFRQLAGGPPHLFEASSTQSSR